jgi:hypothetical protein
MNAATRQHEIAQGNALGNCPKDHPSPERAKSNVPKFKVDPRRSSESTGITPIQGWKPMLDRRTQGDALGCPMKSRWD